MINVNKGKVRVMGKIDIVETEVVVLLISIYNKNPKSIKTILEVLHDYIDMQEEDDD